jgi:hypothetical protein
MINFDLSAFIINVLLKITFLTPAYTIYKLFLRIKYLLTPNY